MKVSENSVPKPSSPALQRLAEKAPELLTQCEEAICAIVQARYLHQEDKKELTEIELIEIKAAYNDLLPLFVKKYLNSKNISVNRSLSEADLEQIRAELPRYLKILLPTVALESLFIMNKLHRANNETYKVLYYRFLQRYDWLIEPIKKKAIQRLWAKLGSENQEQLSLKDSKEMAATKADLQAELETNYFLKYRHHHYHIDFEDPFFSTGEEKNLLLLQTNLQKKWNSLVLNENRDLLRQLQKRGLFLPLFEEITDEKNSQDTEIQMLYQIFSSALEAFAQSGCDDYPNLYQYLNQSLPKDFLRKYYHLLSDDKRKERRESLRLLKNLLTAFPELRASLISEQLNVAVTKTRIRVLQSHVQTLKNSEKLRHALATWKYFDEAFQKIPFEEHCP